MDRYGQEWTKWTMIGNCISEVHAVHTVHLRPCELQLKMLSYVFRQIIK